MNRKEFLAVLKNFINDTRQIISKLEGADNLDKVDTNKMNNIKEMLDKLEQDYFHQNIEIDISNVKKFDEDGNLIKKEKSITEQVQEGLLKIFNNYVETGEYSLGNYDFDYEKYSTSLCQIADRLLQIESDRKLSEEYYKNCTID